MLLDRMYSNLHICYNIYGINKLIRHYILLGTIIEKECVVNLSIEKCNRHLERDFITSSFSLLKYISLYQIRLSPEIISFERNLN